MRFTSKDLSNLPETAELRVSEAVELAHALISRLAEWEGIRILFVKGPTAVALGARPPRPSSDVDVLCEPGGMERLGVALASCGWRRRAPEGVNKHLVHASQYLFEHSTHYIHDDWPCDLDLHYKFPGFLAPDEIVFDTLWARRAHVAVASVPVPAADQLGQVAVVGLHALRDPGSGLLAADLGLLQTVLAELSPEAKADLGRLAAATGSSETLRPLLERAHVPVATGMWNDPEALRRWRVRTASPAIPTSSWLLSWALPAGRGGRR